MKKYKIIEVPIEQGNVHRDPITSTLKYNSKLSKSNDIIQYIKLILVRADVVISENTNALNIRKLNNKLLGDEIVVKDNQYLSPDFIEYYVSVNGNVKINGYEVIDDRVVPNAISLD